ncbi:MAG: bifunctional precorrin-2 dehydrogenase/sirohydrochlorin ferrochelatase [Myxococcota bacterium]
MIALQDAPVFPVFLKLHGKRVVMIGAGNMAEEKLPALLSAGAQVDIVAPVHKFQLHHPNLRWHLREFEPRDLDGAWYVVSAATPDVNQWVAAECEARQIFVNAVDDRRVATAYLGGVVRRSGLTLAISSNGAAPALVALLRQGLEELLPENLDDWVAEAEKLRPGWKRLKLPFQLRRPALLRKLNTLYDRSVA